MWLPFLRIEQLGQAYASSLVGGVRTLFAEGHLFVGAIVLLFSIVLPVVKLSALLVLSQRRWRLADRQRAVVYRMVEHLGRWGMLDVLLVAVMVAFVKLGGLVQFTAGAGLVVFSAFVLLSLCASAAFDPFSLWDEGVALALSAAAGEPPSAGPPATASVRLDHVPHAAAPPEKGDARWWIWLIPVAALAVAGGMIWNVYAHRGRLITIRFQNGHGLSVGDELRYHGIICGEVEAARLTGDLSEVELQVRLTPEADGLAREAARFWIVRPQIDLTGIAGLETVVGSQYLTVLPGPADGPTQTEFVGLEVPPIPDLEEPGGIELVLQSPRGAGLRPGLGVYYRDIRIGGIVSTGLAGDGSAIETRIYIRPGYRHLARAHARFWNAGGVQVRGSLTEFYLHVGTAETLLRGGVAMSLPPDPGEVVAPGHRFVLYESAAREWLEWQPVVTNGRPQFQQPLPVLQPATLRWTHDGLFLNRDRERTGWLLPTPAGLCGPQDLLVIPEDALGGRASLVLNDGPLDLTTLEPATGEGIAVLTGVPSHDVPGVTPRRPTTPEDVYLATGVDATPLFVAAVRLLAREDVWQIDPALPVSGALHGAAVIAASDGALLGRLLCVEDERLILLTPKDP